MEDDRETIKYDNIETDTPRNNKTEKEEENMDVDENGEVQIIILSSSEEEQENKKDNICITLDSSEEGSDAGYWKDMNVSKGEGGSEHEYEPDEWYKKVKEWMMCWSDEDENSDCNTEDELNGKRNK